MHNISYSIKDNHQLNTKKSGKSRKSTPARFTITAKACETIPAHSRCALPFSTPEIALSEAEGSAIIIADNGTEHYEQLINYQRINAHDLGVQALGNISLTGLDVDNGF